MGRENLKLISTKATMMNNDMRVLGLAHGLVLTKVCIYTDAGTLKQCTLPSSLSRGPAYSSRIMRSHVLHSLPQHGFQVKECGYNSGLPAACMMKLRLWRN